MYTNVAATYLALVTAKIGAGLGLHEAQRRALAQIYADTEAGVADPTAATAFLISEECLASGIISGTSNANPDVISTAAAHKLNPGSAVQIGGVLGDLAVNGSFVVLTTPTAQTFTIGYPAPGMSPVAGSGAYVSGGTFSRLTFPNSSEAAALNVPARLAGKNW